MGGLVVGLALLIVVIVIAVLATASAGDETSAVPQQLQMESTTTTTRAGTGATEEEQTVDERPWLEGDYKCGNINWAIVRVEGDSQVLHQLKFLDAESEAEHIMHWQA